MTCAEGTPPAKEETSFGTLENEQFTPIADDQELEKWRGFQGQHCYVTARFYAESGTTWEHDFVLVDPNSGKELGRRNARVTACAPGWNVTPDVVVFIFSSTTAAGVLSLSTSLHNESGEVVRTLTTEPRAIRLRWHEDL